MFTTCTRTGLNTGLRQGHHTATPPRPELDGEMVPWTTLSPGQGCSLRAHAQGETQAYGKDTTLLCGANGVGQCSSPCA